jgi:hypothetical protein
MLPSVALYLSETLTFLGMMMKTVLSRVLPFLCAGLLALPSAAPAQTAADLSPGTRVRVVDAGTGPVVGTVSAVRGDTLVVVSGKGAGAREVALSVSSIRRLQVSRGRPSRPLSALQGAAIGAVTGSVGGVLGTTIGSLQADESCGRAVAGDDLLCFSTAEWAMIGVMIGAPMGAASGAALGFLFPQERWRSISTRHAPAFTVAPAGDAVRLGLSLRVP